MTTLEKIIHRLPFEKITGQTIMGYVKDAKSLGDFKKAALENALGGLIIGREILSSTRSIGKELKELADLYKKTYGFSIILATEREGGRMEKLPQPSIELPSPMGISATGDVKSAYIAGYITALELRTLSINVNLAPVANIYPYETTRGFKENSFGDDPEEVSEYVANYVRGLRNGGVLSFVKYFPRRFFDQHDKNLESLSELYKKEFKPFQTAIKMGVEGVIIGNTPLPAVDSVNTPSSLSPKVVEKVVKRGLGFKNIVLTDCLNGEDPAISIDPKKAAVTALKAGNHIVVPSSDVDDVRNTLEKIIEETGRDKDFLNLVKESALEVLSFKLRKLDKFKKTPDKTRGSLINRTRAWKLFQKSISIVKGVSELPLRFLGKPLVIIANRLLSLLEEPERKMLVETLGEDLRSFELLEHVDELSSRRLNELYRNTPSNTLLMVLTYNLHEDGREASVLKRFVEFFKESVVISLGSPEDLKLFSNAKICVAAFTPSITAVKAALKALKNKTPPSGNLPVKISLES
ncbi:MAG: glycoside hydrolase family 3 N-terminal domain-containing protein [Thermoproteota archaeon]